MARQGVLLVHFQDQESRGFSCDINGILFDKKPFIITPWVPSMSYEKDNLSSRFPGLDVRYWGVSYLTKIAGMLGSFLKLDGATSNKGRLMYARVLVDIDIAKGLCDEMFFENEFGDLTFQGVEYDWKHVCCDKCSHLENLGEACR